MHYINYGGKRAIAYQNVEQISDRPLRHNLLELRYLKKHYPDVPIIASIMGFFEDEWVYLARACEDNGVDILELNFSCPHMCIEGSGHKVGQAFHLLERFTAAVKQAVSIPVMAKMTPNITDMTEPALYAKKGGADAISAINTVRGISEIGRQDWVPRPNVFGVGAISGTSGPAVKPIGLNFIASMAKCRELSLPLSGMGGIETWVDALEYLLVGATTLQVTSGIMHYGYRIVEDLIEGLSDYMTLKGVGRVSDLIGKALPHLQETDTFDLNRQGTVQYDLDACIGCGQCHVVCKDAGGQAIDWNGRKRRPRLIEDKCLSCMLCQAVCPVPGLITFKEMPPGWKRRETAVKDMGLETELKHAPFTKEGPHECVV
jgi:dihydropyrimidine dehydrogenase (NAD+) subunit PreA